MVFAHGPESRRNVYSVGNQDFDKKVFIEHLSKICGENIITDKPRLAVYEADGLTAKKQLPWVVVLPSTIEQVQEIREIEGVSGVHIMGIYWEESVRPITEGAGLLPRPIIVD